MTARDKFIVIALIGLFAVVSVGAVFLDQTRPVGVVPAEGGTYIEGVTSSPQFMEPVLAASDDLPHPGEIEDLQSQSTTCRSPARK